MKTSNDPRVYLLLILSAVLTVLGLTAISASSQAARTPQLPAVTVRRPLPTMKLLLRDGHTIVTIKENLTGVQINITDLVIPRPGN